MKKLEELIDLKEPGWDLVREWFEDAENQFTILPKDAERANTELINAQVTTRSAMGAIIYETGGILIDYGWIRVLGSGCPQLDRGLMEWNKGKSFENYGDRSSFLLVADDVIGGYFAINAGGLGDEIGKVYYLAPDTLEWESLECGYSDFINWLFNGDIESFYESFKWSTWEEDVEKINGNQTFISVPFLWTDEAQEDVDNINRKVVSAEENYAFTMETKKQFNG